MCVCTFVCVCVRVCPCVSIYRRELCSTFPRCLHTVTVEKVIGENEALSGALLPGLTGRTFLLHGAVTLCVHSSPESLFELACLGLWDSGHLFWPFSTLDFTSKCVKTITFTLFKVRSMNYDARHTRGRGHH